ncbi:unnamed protein product [Cladocopium goreaui]|uniref:Integrase catalytic domain-containing protein n=1 Tax=Cladocopium goreaui TaxID=2562237 RepID=A0A9P1G488_9DINO|nr:unnamed protein product [Cladocopium goreaui]
MVTRPAESEDSSNMPSLKCRRIGEKQAPSAAYQQLQEQQRVERIVQCAMKTAPKVGKRFFMEGELIQEVQKCFPDMKIIGVETCKGADRCRPPPKEVSSQRAPFRRTMGVHRQTSQAFCDETWEEWPLLKRKQLIRNCQPARLLITIFAQSLEPVDRDARSEPGSSSSTIPRASEDSSKRIRLTEPKPNETVPPEQKPMHVQSPDPEPSGVRAEHGPKFMQLSTEQRQQLIRMHNNLGHPDSTLLGNVLKDQKWPPEAIEGIKDMHCSACFERQKPRLARPSHLGEPRQFNDLVAIDSIKWTNAQGQSYLFYHIIDTSSNYHVAIPCEHRPNSEQLALLFTKYWINWAGPPKMLLHDSAGEFCSEEFARYLQGYDIRSSTIPAEAHWQLGRCERHGAILQAMLEKWQVQSFMKNLTMREQARIAFVKADHDMKLRRSLLRRSRPDRGQFLPNQWVMYWRSGKGALPGSWHGPARVIMPESQGIVWVSHQSRLYRCAPEHLRNLSQRESEIPEVKASPEPPPFPQAMGTGIDVALPDTDEGEDSLLATKVTQDYWEICKGKVIRHHVVPRIKMFNPVCIEDVPVPLEWLESKRHTRVTPKYGPCWEHFDEWRGNILGAKAKEISSWLSTETVRRIARSQIPEEQILRSRWVLTWKPRDESDPMKANQGAAALTDVSLAWSHQWKCAIKCKCIIHDVDAVLQARADKRSKKMWMNQEGSGSETQGVIRRVQKEPLVRLGARLRSQGALSDQVVKEIQLKVRPARNSAVNFAGPQWQGLQWADASNPRKRRAFATVSVDVGLAPSDDHMSKSVAALGNSLHSQLDRCNPQDHANFLWSMVVLTAAERQMCGAIAQSACDKLDEFSSTQLSAVLWAVSKASFDEPTLFQASAGRLRDETMTKSLGTQHVANLLWSFAVAQQRPEMVHGLTSRAMEMANEFRSQELTGLLWAFAGAGWSESALIGPLARSSTLKVLDFRADELATVAAALARLNQDSSGLYRSCLQRLGAVPARWIALSADEVVATLWALARAKKHLTVEMSSIETNIIEAAAAACVATADRFTAGAPSL